MRSASRGSTSVVRTVRVRSETVCSARHSTSAPRSASRSMSASTSRICGTLCSTTSSSVRRLAASSGSAAFLFPAGTTVPDRGCPPSITSFSTGGAARVTVMSQALSRDDAWSLFRSWTESESLRKHVLAVEAAMRAYARRLGGDEELWGVVGLLHDLDYERHPDLETGHPRIAMAELERLGQPPEVIRAIASHADYLGVSRDSPMEKALYAVDELCGFLMACAYVRPQGIHGLTPKSVKKKMKQPSFAAAVNQIGRAHV